MLAMARLQALVLTSDIERARDFYGETLGLGLAKTSHGALVYGVGGCDLRVSPVVSTQPSEHTVLGFAVEDLEGVVVEIAARGIQLERFAGMPHDNRGVLTTSDGSQVIWFRDPDGNLLSVVQYARP